MRRLIARHMGWWMRLFVASVIVLRFTDWPWPLEWGLTVGFFALSLVRARDRVDRAPVEVAPPVRGRWVALNSPGSQVPSHGVKVYGQSYAVDLTHPNPPSTPTKVGWGLGMRRPDVFSSFGEPVRAVADGVVVATVARRRDHRSRESWPSLLYLMVVEQIVRSLAPLSFVLGNHVVVDHGDGVWSAYAHLRRGSLRVAVGDRVSVGDRLGEVGNSGNTSEPHLHVQLMDHPAPSAAAGVPFRWRDIEITGDTDPSRARKPVSTDIEPGLPADGQVFTAA